MAKYALLCGAAPLGYRQKKIEEKQNSLEKCSDYKPGSVVVFPNGIEELFLESVLNEAFEKVASEDDENTDSESTGEVILYLCAQSKADLNAELSDCCAEGVTAFRLGNYEIRKEVISYYYNFAEELDLNFCVSFDTCSEYLNEDDLGYEPVSVVQKEAMTGETN